MEISEPHVTLSVTLHPDVALQLAQFCKRSQYEQFFDLTEAHLPNDIRRQRAYQMISGIEAVASALADAGFAPR